MAAEQQAVRLALRLKELRETQWPEARLTQAQLGTAFGITSATVSSWESTTSPKTPNDARIEAYARFFATERSLDDPPHLIPETELTESEKVNYRALEQELLGILQTRDAEPRSILTFVEGPVTVICPATPLAAQGTLARENDPNFTKLQRYADLDALIEIYGHIRAANPTIDVSFRLAADVRADDMSSHVILLGGVGWNEVTKRFQGIIGQVPITQFDVKGYQGDPFRVEGGDEFYPSFEGEGETKSLTEDVAYLVRLPNPFNSRRTLTICNGVHSRGVYGAVRCLTDPRVREANEEYLAQRFPDGRFALLLRVPVIANETLSPDLQIPHTRLYEWPPAPGALR